MAVSSCFPKDRVIIEKVYCPTDKIVVVLVLQRLTVTAKKTK